MAKSLLDSVGDPCEVANAVLAIIRGFNLFMSFKHVMSIFFLCSYMFKLFFKY